jgi:hypothetical protein
MQPKNPALREAALSRWDSEGGSVADAAPDALLPEGDALAPVARMTHTEWVHLRMRLIALENVVIALLAVAPESQLALVRDMAACIAPRPGATPHPLAVRAAAQMVQLVERAGHFRAG